MRTRHCHRLPGKDRPQARTPSKALTGLLAGAALALFASPAQAGSIDVIRDCSEDGTLEKPYSQRELSGALDTLPSDLDEYTDCRSVIRGAQLAGARGGGPAGEKHGKAGDRGARVAREQPTSNEATEIDRTSRSKTAVKVGRSLIRPGETGARLGQSGFGGDLPGLVLATLLSLAAATLWAGGFALQRRRPAFWRAAGAALAAPARRIGHGVRRGISRFRR
jgi:hypothetical protein